MWQLDKLFDKLSHGACKSAGLPHYVTLRHYVRSEWVSEWVYQKHDAMWKVDNPNYKKRDLQAKALKSIVAKLPHKVSVTFLFTANCRAPVRTCGHVEEWHSVPVVLKFLQNWTELDGEPSTGMPLHVVGRHGATIAFVHDFLSLQCNEVIFSVDSPQFTNDPD